MGFNLWCFHKLAQLEKNITDEQYGEQYDKLFPDCRLKEGEFMQALNSGAPAEENFIGAIRYAYLDCWKAINRVPSVYDIEEYMTDYINETVIAYMDESHIEDSLYWSDSEYREEIIDDCLEDTFADYEYYGLHALIAECLVWLDYTAVVDNNVKPGEELEYIIRAQSSLIPDKYGDSEWGGI